MHRFYVPPEHCAESTFFLSGREAYHALRVLRLRRGERVVVLDGSGHELLCEIQDHNRDKVRLTVVEKRLVPRLPCQITLVQALPKGKLIETIIQKATELGVARIVPLLSERVVAQVDGQEAVHKAEKWQLVAIEAIKQCGAAWLPRVEAPLALQQYLARNEKLELGLVGALQGERYHPRSCFQAFFQKHARLPHSACIWVGPEGDFTAAELEAIKASGALPITLGPHVLRAETATVYCLAIVNYEIQITEFDKGCPQAPKTSA